MNEWYQEPGKEEKGLIKVGMEDGKAWKRWKRCAFTLI